MSLSNILKQTDIFHEFTSTQLELVAMLCEERHCRTGEVLFEENDSSDELYIIAQGDVDILIKPASVEGKETKTQEYITVATLSQGQSFGEVALVDKGLRSATARCAATDTHLLVIPSNKLSILCETYPKLGYHLMRNLAADLALKIRNTDMRIREELMYGRTKHKA